VRDGLDDFQPFLPIAVSASFTGWFFRAEVAFYGVLLAAGAGLAGRSRLGSQG
jgi:hypothetical protein